MDSKIKCEWCFKEVEKDYLITEDGEYIHVKCYRELDKLVKDC